MRKFVAIAEGGSEGFPAAAARNQTPLGPLCCQPEPDSRVKVAVARL